LKNILHVGFGIFLGVSAGYTSAMLAMIFVPPIWAAIIGSLVFGFTMLFLDNFQPRTPFVLHAGTPEAEEHEARMRQQTITLPSDHAIVKQWQADHDADQRS